MNMINTNNLLINYKQDVIDTIWDFYAECGRKGI